jgi:DUF971 family protein
MNDSVPSHIAVHQKSRTLEVHFSDGEVYLLPAEYLRVFSPSAEARITRSKGAIVTGKQRVSITGVEPVGAYAVRILFDDGHRTGIYSWPILRDLGQQQDNNWQEYQARLKLQTRV